MNIIQKTGILILSLVAASCSTKKDAFLNRNFHAVATKYNVLFNGEVAFQEGVRELNSKYEDDFWELLPIEPIKFEENSSKGSSLETKLGWKSFSNKDTDNQNLSSFERAEEKAVKAIQKHSMRFYGKEKNRQIDDAYLLLGKSRYYTERFIPAIEAFNYIIANYPKANLINETKIWRAKANIRIDNPELAVETLSLMLRNQELPEVIREQAHTTMAMAYMKMDSIHLVKEQLWFATQTSKNHTQSARNLFILGQLYALEQNTDTANIIFKRLVDFKKAPYKFRIYADIEKAKNTVLDSSTVVFLKHFKKLIKNRDNRPYLDALYYQIAELERGRDSINSAVVNYNLSLRTNNGTAKQKTFSYERLADIYFKDLDYVMASYYYDSVLNVAQDKQNLRIKRIERRARNLTSLTRYEKMLKTNDSVLNLVAMTDEERNTFFKTHIEKLKKEDQEKAKVKLSAISFGNSFGGSGLQSAKSKGKWYFYNTQSMGFGKGEFQRIWGNRPLEDNWRWSDKTIIKKEAKSQAIVARKLEKYEVSTYLSTIPSEKKEIDSLEYNRNRALFELGLIYKEQFKNIPKAITNLERLLSLDPEKELILPANYHLYQMYAAQGDPKGNTYKNVVLTDYKNTPFAKIILNPDKELKKDEQVDEIEALYKIAYNLYKDASFEETRCFIETMLPEIGDSVLIPKFVLLRAYAIGKYNSKEFYIAELEKVAVDHSQTEQGKKALELIKQLKQ